jgi:hypothetical protein
MTSWKCYENKWFHIGMTSWECYENKWFYMKYIGKIAETESLYMLIETIHTSDHVFPQTLINFVFKGENFMKIG